MSRGNGKGCNESTKNNFTKILLLHKWVWIVFVLCPSLLLPAAISVLTNEPNLVQSTEMIFRLESSKISLPLCLGSHLKMQTARGVYITRRGRRWIMAWSSVHYASLINAAGARSHLGWKFLHDSQCHLHCHSFALDRRHSIKYMGETP